MMRTPATAEAPPGGMLGQCRRRLSVVSEHMSAPCCTTGTTYGLQVQASAVVGTDTSGAADGLTSEELEFFAREGYLVIRRAAEPAACAQAVESMFRAAGRDPDDRNTWYRAMPSGLTRSGTRHPVQMRHQADLEAHMVRAEHCQAAWDIRTSPRMHKCFSQLWRTERLWLNNSETPEMARPLFNLKPPVSTLNPGWGGGTYLHWDASVEPDQAPPLHHGLQIQGVLYLADTPLNGGGLRVVAGFHRLLERDPQFARQWHETRQVLPDNGPGGCMDLAELSGLPVTQLAGRAGDLVVWNSLLPHGTGKNTALQPRRALFVSMTPVDRLVAQHPSRDYATVREARTIAWHGHVQSLGPNSSLGKRLIGVEEW